MLAPESGSPDEPGDADEVDDTLLGELLDPLPEPSGEDDETIGDAFDPGLDLPFDRDADHGPDADAELELGDLSALIHELPEGDDGEDALGPAAAEEALDGELDAISWLDDGDDEEGPIDPSPELTVPTALHDNPEDEEEVEAELDLEPELVFGDEPRPPVATPLWTEARPGPALESCGALALAHGTVVAASTDLLWFSPGELSPLRLEAGSMRIRSLVLLGPGVEYAICSTETGRLLRRGRSKAASEELVLPEGSTAPREALELCQPGGSHANVFFARSARGEVFVSDDGGTSFRRVALPEIRAMGAGGGCVAALSTEGALYVSQDAGATFSRVALSGLALRIARAASPKVAVAGSLVVLCEPSVGVLTSVDQGHVFRHVPGTHGASALHATDGGPSPLAFVALPDDAADRVSIVRINAESGMARVVVELGGGPGDDDSEGLRVAALAWDADSSRLWVAGSFGVRAYAAPSASSVPAISGTAP